MTLFKYDDNDTTSPIVHKIIECVLFLGGKVTGDYVYSMINEDIKPTHLEVYIIDYSKLLEMISTILELSYTVITIPGNYNNANLKIKLNKDVEITMKLKMTDIIPQEYFNFEHELLTLSSNGLYVRDFYNKTTSNLIKVTKMIKNKQLKSFTIQNTFSNRDLFIKHVELNKIFMKKKKEGWSLINPEELVILNYSLYREMYGDYEDSCSICIEGFDNNSNVFKTKCKHLFHVTCWMRNINSNISSNGGVCPNCRDNVWKNNIHINITQNMEIDEYQTQEFNGID